jgi:D-glycero-D-manno-heptose 1,7-bisphosphate phosphatase
LWVQKRRWKSYWAVFQDNEKKRKCISMKKAVFLDRDGTVIHGVPYLSSPEELVLLPHSTRAIRLFKEEGFMVFITTNQSGVARGYFTEERLREIHERLFDMLQRERASVDAIYYCPHLPEGKVSEYSIECLCRKPRAGMLMRAAREHGIVLRESIMIGDTPGDVLAGKTAGCKTVLIKTHEEVVGTNVDADLVANNIWDAAQILCAKEGGVIVSGLRPSQ